jgi:ABC-type sugar transport system permease subunit
MLNAQPKPTMSAPRSRSRGSGRGVWPYVFVAPFFLLFAVFGVYPVVYSLWLSFFDWNGAPGREVWVGFENFALVLRDDIFWQSMLNVALIWLLHFPLMVALALLLAVWLNGHLLRLQGLWRALVFLPYLTNMVAAGFVFRLLLETDSGFVNQILGVFGIGPVLWLDSPWGARVSVALLLLWAWVGYEMVVILAALQTIPSELEEAATVDGANRPQIFWFVTLPLLRPTLVFVTMISVIGTFALFTEPGILTRGGPVNATLTPTMTIFAAAFRDLKFGYSSAMSYVYFVTILIATLVQLAVERRAK